MGKVKSYYFDEINALPSPNEPYNEEYEAAMMAEYQENLKTDPAYSEWLDDKPF